METSHDDESFDRKTVRLVSTPVLNALFTGLRDDRRLVRRFDISPAVNWNINSHGSMKGIQCISDEQNVTLGVDNDTHVLTKVNFILLCIE